MTTEIISTITRDVRVSIDEVGPADYTVRISYGPEFDGHEEYIFTRTNVPSPEVPGWMIWDVTEVDEYGNGSADECHFPDDIRQAVAQRLGLDWGCKNARFGMRDSAAGRYWAFADEIVERFNKEVAREWAGSVKSNPDPIEPTNLRNAIYDAIKVFLDQNNTCRLCAAGDKSHSMYDHIKDMQALEEEEREQQEA